MHFSVDTKDFRASGPGQVKRLTAATAAITLAHLFVEMLGKGFTLVLESACTE